MLIYWCLFLVLIAGTILSQSRDERRPWLLFVLFASIPTILMIGLRWKIGPDWIAYIEIYKYAQLFTFNQALIHIDPGFFLLNWALRARCLTVCVGGKNRASFNDFGRQACKRTMN